MARMITHTPFDGSSPPFNIGLSKLDPADWIEVDDLLVEYLAEKDRVAASFPDKVFVAEPGSQSSQAEVLELLATHVVHRFPELYRRCGQEIHIAPASRFVRLDDAIAPPLRIAAKLVQEDLLLMRKGPAGWRLAAGSLSFPSSWHLLEKFGRPMHEIHAPVPGFGAGTRNASLIARMFDNLRSGQLALRWNWSLYDDAELYHPGAGNGVRRFGSSGDTSSVFIRVERQTLRKLSVSGDILFTIRIHVNPLNLLALQPNRQALAGAMAAQVASLSEPQLAYKGLSEERARLLKRLEEFAA